jgi:thiamine biosynthesis lipoprotein
LATSGNYRNYYNVNGIQYAHTINTKTGFPEKNQLLSVSVFAEDCMTADAFATACMAMGLEKAFDLISRSKGLDGYFIYSEDDGNMMYMHTKGLEDILVD